MPAARRKPVLSFLSDVSWENAGFYFIQGGCISCFLQERISGTAFLPFLLVI